MALADAIPTPSVDERASPSAVSWGAIVAGAAAAGALSLILLILGTGLGLTAVSPWTNYGASAAAFGIGAIAWVTFTQLAAAGLGGYIAGRLRTRWAAVNPDEVYFRDTAHGFLAWCVATLITAGLLTGSIAAILQSGVEAGATVAGGAAAGATTGAKADNTSGPLAYYVDALFRKDANAPAPAAPGTAGNTTEQASAEVSRIFMQTLRSGPLPADDARYVGQLVAQRTGLSQADAEKRVGELYARAQTNLRAAADKARKATAYTSLWLFISLLAGAFVASLTATFGGRQRDR